MDREEAIDLLNLMIDCEIAGEEDAMKTLDQLGPPVSIGTILQQRGNETNIKRYKELKKYLMENLK